MLLLKMNDYWPALQLVDQPNWILIGFSFTLRIGESELTMKRFKILWFLSQTKALQYCADDTVWCNGVKDCIDGRDEIGCANYVCANPDVSLFNKFVLFRSSGISLRCGRKVS